MRPVNNTYRATALMLAILMFCTSAGFSLDIHYCQGKAKTFSVFGSAKGCSALETTRVACLHQRGVSARLAPVAMERKGCCENRHFLFQSHQAQVTPATQIVRSPSLDQSAILDVANVFRSIVVGAQIIDFCRYEPPPLLRDIPVLMQVFLL